MNKSEFEELTNAYFDREISTTELARLKKELAENVDRKREFELNYRLHQATCSVLSNKNPSFSEQDASKISSPNRLKYRSSLTFSLGMAACFLVLLATSILVTREQANNLDTFVEETSDLPDEANYSGNQESELPLQGNLSSQLRLAGLTPDIAPANQQLSRFDTEALRQREAHLQDMIQQVDPYRIYSAIPEQRLVESSGHIYEAPAGFKSSLASFK